VVAEAAATVAPGADVPADVAGAAVAGAVVAAWPVVGAVVAALDAAVVAVGDDPFDEQAANASAAAAPAVVAMKVRREMLGLAGLSLPDARAMAVPP
jgi:hypothetical protein